MVGVTAQPSTWTVIVPVKAPARGKSRIALPPADRERVAAAMLADTVAAIAAARQVKQVLIVLDDTDPPPPLEFSERLRLIRTGQHWLNGAIGDAAATVAGPVAVLPGDLPSLTSAELDAALDEVHRLPPEVAMAVIADRQAVGTTLLAARDAGQLDPHYGADSLRRHLAAGARALPAPADSGIRRDVDTVADLAAVTAGSTGRLVAELIARPVPAMPAGPPTGALLAQDPA